MTFDGQIAAAIGVPVFLGVVWLVRLEGRINGHDTLFTEVKADISEIKADVKELLKRR